MTIDTHSAAHAAKHTAVNLGWYAVICIVLAIGYIAYDTHLFTKPLSWTVVRDNLGYDTRN